MRKRYVKILYTRLVGFSGCKQTYTNIEKRLKQISAPPPKSERKVLGIYNRCLKKNFQKFQKPENEKSKIEKSKKIKN